MVWPSRELTRHQTILLSILILSIFTIMHLQYIVAYLALVPAIQATYIKKWNLGGCGGSSYQRCNRLPSGECCGKGRPTGGSMRIGNMPHDYDIAVPYNGNRAAAMMNDRDHGWCKSVRLSDVQFGDLNCLSKPGLGTGIWLACASRLSAQVCFSHHSHPKREIDFNDTMPLSEFGEQGHPGFIDEEEAALPEMSYHDAYGNQMEWDDYNRLADLELEHEANGTLHLLYPDLYEAPLEKRKENIDLSVFVNKGCHGQRLARIHKEGCTDTPNGAGVLLHSLPNNCNVFAYTRANCVGDRHLDVGEGARKGCYDAGNFNSLTVECSVLPHHHG